MSSQEKRFTLALYRSLRFFWYLYTEKPLRLEGLLDGKELYTQKYFDVLYVIGSTRGESKRYRVENVLCGLREAGYRVGIIDSTQCALLLSLPAPRVLVFFRMMKDPAFPLDKLVTYVQQVGGKVFYDIDDLIFEREAIENTDTFLHLSSGRFLLHLHDAQLYRDLMALCDFGTTTTPSLAERMHASGLQTYVIPNTLNAKQLAIAESMSVRQRNDGTVVIIYASGSKTHQKDFDECAEALADVMRGRTKIRFVLIGHLHLPALFDDLADRIERKPFMPFAGLLRETAAADINIAPLEMGSLFNDCKSELKIFEAGIVKVPTVASRTDSYARCITEGIDGELAETPEQWRTCLFKLVDSPDLRRSMGEKARKTALERFTYQKAAHLAVEIYGLEEPEVSDSSPVTKP